MEEDEFIPEVRQEHVEALASMLSVPIDEISIWSDGSLMDRSHLGIQDYYVVDADSDLTWLDENYSFLRDVGTFKVYTNIEEVD